MTPEQKFRIICLVGIAGFVILHATMECLKIYASRFNRTPLHTSRLTGDQWVQELTDGHEERFHNKMGMCENVFTRLLELLVREAGLRDMHYVTAREQLAIFIHYVRRGLSNRALQERFQRSTDTISKSVHCVMDALTFENIYCALVDFPTDDVPIPQRILSSTSFTPYFDGCIGALDGTHMPVHVPEARRTAFRNRKGGLSQNVLAVCSFDMKFLYVLAGWEGSASDSRVFEDALRRGFTIPKDRYYLADAGYANCDALLVPYRGIHYHLREWGIGNERPWNYKELFNFQHAQLRNVIERIFGVMKRCFRVLQLPQEYPIETQVQLVSALAVIHNFIRIFDPSDKELDAQDASQETNNNTRTDTRDMGHADDQGNASRHREEIAQAMWRDYEARSRRR